MKLDPTAGTKRVIIQMTTTTTTTQNLKTHRAAYNKTQALLLVAGEDLQ